MQFSASRSIRHALVGRQIFASDSVKAASFRNIFAVFGDPSLVHASAAAYASKRSIIIGSGASKSLTIIIAARSTMASHAVFWLSPRSASTVTFLGFIGFPFHVFAAKPCAWRIENRRCKPAPLEKPAAPQEKTFRKLAPTKFSLPHRSRPEGVSDF